MSSRLLPRASSLVACLVVAACTQTTTRPETNNGAAGNPSGTAGAAAGTTGAAGAGEAGSGEAGATATGGSSGLAGGGGSGAAGAASAGAAGSDAGAANDAATTDAPSEGHGGCAGALCESFDGTVPGKMGSPWLVDVDTKGTVVEVVSDKGRTDTHSLHVKVSATAGIHGYVTETQSLAATGASFWGRVFIWYAVETPTGHIVNVAVDGKMANGMSEQVRIVNVIGNHIATNRRSDDMGKGSNVAPPAGKWSCYEWHLTPSSLDVYLDGTMLPISETWIEPTLGLLRIGFERFTAGAAGDLWLDDVGVGADRLGCQ